MDIEGGCHMTLTKHLRTKKLILTFVAVSILILLLGCSTASKDQSQVASSTQGKENVSPNPPAANTQDQDLTKKLTSEKIVDSGQVYLAGDNAVAVIMIKKGTDEKTTKGLATKYAKTMKQKYNNMKINTHAFIESKEIAHITL
jgi:preprotein translocase subunit SecF